MLKDTENHQMICSQGEATDSLSKTGKESSHNQSQRQNDDGFRHRSNSKDKMENLSKRITHI